MTQVRPFTEIVFVLLLLSCALILIPAEPCYGQDLLGASSCGGGTCHGGVNGNGPHWKSSLFEFVARDPHVHAGTALTNELGRQIAERLTPKETGEDYEASVARTLVERCAACHVTLESSGLPDSFDRQSVHTLAERGVSCESCHGAASLWIDKHWEKDWNSATSGLGMRDTKSWLTRTEGCARCHIGSRREDGLVRDMNHDMIAAGHPPLRFDMMLYMEMLPRHWDHEPQSVDVGRAHQAASVVTLQAATKLSIQREADSQANALVVQPELSEFDCHACHHSIQVSRMLREGKPQWNPWYMDGYFSNHAWSLESALTTLPKKYVARILNTKASTPMQGSGSVLQSALLNTPDNWPRDWNDIATWWTRVVPYTLESEFKNPLSAQAKQQLRQLLLEFSQKHLQFKSGDGQTVQSLRFDKQAVSESTKQIVQVLSSHQEPSR